MRRTTRAPRIYLSGGAGGVLRRILKKSLHDATERRTKPLRVAESCAAMHTAHPRDLGRRHHDELLGKVVVFVAESGQCLLQGLRVEALTARRLRLASTERTHIRALAALGFQSPAHLTESAVERGLEVRLPWGTVWLVVADRVDKDDQQILLEFLEVVTPRPEALREPLEPVGKLIRGGWWDEPLPNENMNARRRRLPRSGQSSLPKEARATQGPASARCVE
jgi:hypothetical protein